MTVDRSLTDYRESNALNQDECLKQSIKIERANAAMISSLVLCGCFLISAWLLDSFLRRSKRLRSKLEKQGIRGPSPSLLYGNIAEIRKINNRVQENLVKRSADSGVKLHSWPSTALPHLLQWRDEYGMICCEFLVFLKLILKYKIAVLLRNRCVE